MFNFMANVYNNFTFVVNFRKSIGKNFYNLIVAVAILYILRLRRNIILVFSEDEILIVNLVNLISPI